jgi:hypothetical protein
VSILVSLLKDLVRGHGKDDQAASVAPQRVPDKSAGQPPGSAAFRGPARDLRERRIVLLLAGDGENDAIDGLLREYQAVFKEKGRDARLVNLSNGSVSPQALHDLVSSGDVAYALSYLGIGAGITLNVPGDPNSPLNLWDYFGIPVLKLNGDIPAYFAERHEAPPATSINIYYAREFHHYAERWIGRGQAGVLNVWRPPFPISCIGSDQVDRARKRNGRIIFLKNGNSPNALVEQWRTMLPRAVSRCLVELCEELRPACLDSAIVYLDDLVLAGMARRGYSANLPPRLIHFFVAQIDDYYRRIKSTMIAEALLDYPVVVQGRNWEHVNFYGRKAVLVPGASFADSLKVYQRELGVIDMSPNINSAPHDRVTRSAGTYSLCLTNRQQWLLDDFPEFGKMAFAFKPDSIRECVEGALQRPEEYVDLGVAFGRRARELWSVDRVVDKLNEAAELGMLLHAAPRPQLQPYFAW